jgi:hypothetical protein
MVVLSIGEVLPAGDRFMQSESRLTVRQPSYTSIRYDISLAHPHLAAVISKLEDRFLFLLHKLTSFHLARHTNSNSIKSCSSLSQ